MHKVDASAATGPAENRRSPRRESRWRSPAFVCVRTSDAASMDRVRAGTLDFGHTAPIDRAAPPDSDRFLHNPISNSPRGNLSYTYGRDKGRQFAATFGPTG